MNLVKQSVVSLVIISLLLVLVSYANNQKALREANEKSENLAPTVEEPITRTPISLVGKLTCLPHKNTDGPQTLECAFGLHGEDGNFYALDFGGKEIPHYSMGKKLRVLGTLTPIEMLSTDFWQRYNVKGIITVSEIIEMK